MDKDKISTKQVIGPFDLKPGESKEFMVSMPIPEGMSRDEVFEMVKDSDIVIAGTYQDKDGNEHHFRERVKCGGRRKINEISIISLIVGIIFLIVTIYSLIIGLKILAPLWIFLAIVNFYSAYKFGIWRKG